MVAFSETSIRNIFIPPHITKICEETFSRCDHLQSIHFSENSELKIVEGSAFVDSSIESISLPSKVSELNEGWCHDTPNLTQITVIPNNKNFSFLNEKFIVGKSSIDNDNYDILFFAIRNIEKVIIPSFIKIIGPYSFETCNKLSKIELSNDSELQKIEKYSFLNSTIESMTIPSKVTHICEGAFSSCSQLRKIEISSNSELK